MDLSLEFRTPIENRHPSKVVSRSRTPNIFMPSHGVFLPHDRDLSEAQRFDQRSNNFDVRKGLMGCARRRRRDHL